MTIKDFNNLTPENVFEELFKCCGSSSWAKNLSLLLPFSNLQDALEKSDRVWANCTASDGHEAFTHHPKIGDIKSLEKKFASTKIWAGGEQAGVNNAAQETLLELAAGNEAYEKKFNYIFIVCATGKSAEEMLNLLNQRIGNDAEKELKIAMNEQNKITHLRLEKLLA